MEFIGLSPIYGVRPCTLQNCSASHLPVCTTISVTQANQACLPSPYFFTAIYSFEMLAAAAKANVVTLAAAVRSSPKRLLGPSTFHCKSMLLYCSLISLCGIESVAKTEALFLPNWFPSSCHSLDT